MKLKNGRLTLVLTNKCNLKCVYCYEHQKGNAIMSSETARVAITQEMTSQKYKQLDIYLFGGEPFLAFDLVKEIVEWMESKSWEIPYRFTISTNGVCLKKEIKQWLCEHRKRLYIVLSLDGNKISHDLNRNNSYEKIDIDFFKQNWPGAGIKMTISELSLPRLCDNVVHIHTIGMKFSDCNFALGIVWNKNNIHILKEQMYLLYKYYCQNPQIELANIIDMPIDLCESKKEIIKICEAGENRTIYIDGKDYPCNYITPMGFDKEELQKIQQYDLCDYQNNEDMECFNECYLYPICPNCYAANYSVNHCINKRNKSMCGLIKVQAYYSALLQAEKIKKLDYKDISDEYKTILHKKIQAIKKIILLYKG